MEAFLKLIDSLKPTSRLLNPLPDELHEDLLPGFDIQS